MKIAIFTSFATNYLAKSRVMAQTVAAINPDIDVIALVADRFPDSIAAENEPFKHIWYVEDYPADNISAWIFRHSIMELATAIKGWGLRRLLDMGYDYVMYLDPDCLVLEDPARIIDILPEGKSAAVVPHTTSPADTDEEIRLIETSSLRHGIYNLGFLLVKNDANGVRLADWWAARLDRYCVDDFENGLFTDQRWFDLAVGYFEFIHISRHAGIDVASWNVGQRALARNGEGYTIDGDPLIFYHFSGVGPAGVHRWVREKFAPSDPLVSELEFRYEQLLEKQGQSRLAKVKPFFDFYSDGTPIDRLDRKLYRSDASLVEAFPKPFDAATAPSFRIYAASARGVTVREAAPSANTADEAPADPGIDPRRLFDAQVYCAARQMTLADPERAWQHYLEHGFDPNSRPNRFFDTGWYLAMVDPVVVRQLKTPLHHFAALGVQDLTQTSWCYSEAFYLAHYPEIAAAIRAGDISCGLEHYALYGWKEGRSGVAFFNEKAYLTRHQDVSAAVEAGHFLSGSHHYLHHGAREKRQLA